MRTYPEWFVGGPWHGRDKTRDLNVAHLQGQIRVAHVRNSQIDYSEQILAEYVYVPKFVDIWGERLCVWIGEQDAALTDVHRRESEWLKLLGQMMLAPHRTDEGRSPVGIDDMTRRHRDRRSIEQEARREMEAHYRERLEELETQVREWQRLSVVGKTVSSFVNHRIPNDMKSACVVEIHDENGEACEAYFTDVVVYFDQGDGTEENPPSWVATAQEDQDGKHGPFTGYGTTPKAAMLALLADGLGVYARMIEIGERTR